MVKVVAWCCLLALTILLSEAVAQDVSCLNQLVPCLNYLNSTRRPSGDCCDPLKSIVESNPQCLCSNLNSNVATGQSAINVTQVLQIPVKCGLKVNAASCATGSPPSTKNSVPSSASWLSLANALLGAVFSVVLQMLWA